MIGIRTASSPLVHPQTAVSALLACLALGLAAFLPPAPGGLPVGYAARTTGNHPNIVVLMTDDQTVADMQALPRTQRLIGARGVTFRHTFVSYPMCCPARATYLTGQYAHNHGVLYNHGPNGGYQAFKHPETSFPAALQRAGYHTIHIGKLLNGFGAHALAAPPGWDDFRGALDPTTYNYYGFVLDENGRRHVYPRSEHNYRTDVYARLASAIISREARSGHPFFLNVAFLAPHSSGPQEEAAKDKQPARVMRGMMDNRLAVPPLRARGRFHSRPLPHPASFNEADLSDKPSFMRRGSLFRRFTQEDRTDIAARYHARLESLVAVDDAVERIVHTLKATSILDHTVIIFTSDNGFFHGEHRIRAGKYFVYDPATHVPLLVRGPGIRKGVIRDELVGNIDLAPTILDIAHATPLRTMDGRSFLPLLRSARRSAPRERALLLESGPNDEYPAVYHAIRTTRYLYVEYNTGDRELYDLKRDPNELSSRHNDPRYAAVRARLARHLAVLQSCKGTSCR